MPQLVAHVGFRERVVDLQKGVLSINEAIGSTSVTGGNTPRKINDEDKQKILDKCSELISWLDKNQTAEKEEFEHQQKELEKVCNPIITKLYQTAGGMPGGMPGGFPGGGAPPSGGASSGPTIEEVD
ncbi:hypothetical protein ACRRTK_017848 [Alexandromys fortis]